MRKHHEYLIAQYALTNNKRRTTTLYPPDIRYLIEDLFGELNDDLDVDMVRLRSRCGAHGSKLIMYRQSRHPLSC